MGFYTETILKKDENNKKQTYLGKDLLYKSFVNQNSTSLIDQTQFIVHDILNKFGYKNIDWINNIRTIDDLLDSLFDPVGIMYDKQTISKEFIRSRTDYVIAFTEDNQAVMLTPSLTGYRIYDIQSDKTFSLNKIKLKPEIYVIYRPFSYSSNKNISILKLILQLSTVKDIIPLTIFTALTIFLAMISVSINRYVLSDIILITDFNIALTALLTAALFYLGIGIVRAISNIAKTFLFSNTMNRIAFQVQAAIMMKLLLQKSSFFKKSSSGKTSIIIKNTRTVTYTILKQLLDTGISTIFTIAYIGQMIFLAPSLVGPSLIMITVQIAISLLSALKAYKNNKLLLEAQTENNNFTFQTMKGIQKIKTVGAESRFFYRWSKQFSKIINHSLNQPILVKLTEPITMFISNITSIIIIVVAINNYVTYADYNSYVITFGLASGIIFSLVNCFTDILKIKPNIDQLKTVFTKLIDEQKSKKYMYNLSGSIQVKNVSFKYSGSNTYCLNDISFTINRGEKVAFVGTSGSGKSTLMKLLLGLEEVNSGIISFNNIPLANINLRSLRKRVGSVFQFSQVIPGTIRDNVLLSCSEEKTDEDIWKTLKDVDIYKDIKKLPLQLDTEITDTNNGGFSGGQKQRIVIARAILGNPSIVILDEATSALDNLTQKHVLDSIYKLDSTVVMVAHRISTIQKCDKIFVLKEGSIVECGKYDELINNNGYFSELVNNQLAEESKS